MIVFRPTRLVGAAVLAVAGLLLAAGPASAQPGYGDDELTISLSATRVDQDGDVTADGAGFVPGESVEATVFSDPIRLGEKDADGGGGVSFTFSARELDPGEHRVVFEAPSGSVTARFIVVGDGGGDDGDDSSSDGSSGDSSDGSSSDGSSDDSSDGSSSDDSSSGSSSGGSSSGHAAPGDLAFTGSNVIVPLSIVGVLLVIGGGAALVGGRRKRAKTRV